jgi:hypothetical protein
VDRSFEQIESVIARPRELHFRVALLFAALLGCREPSAVQEVVFLA